MVVFHACLQLCTMDKESTPDQTFTLVKSVTHSFVVYFKAKNRTTIASSTTSTDMVVKANTFPLAVMFLLLGTLLYAACASPGAGEDGPSLKKQKVGNPKDDQDESSKIEACQVMSLGAVKMLSNVPEGDSCQTRCDAEFWRLSRDVVPQAWYLEDACQVEGRPVCLRPEIIDLGFICQGKGGFCPAEFHHDATAPPGPREPSWQCYMRVWMATAGFDGSVIEVVMNTIKTFFDSMPQSSTFSASGHVLEALPLSRTLDPLIQKLFEQFSWVSALDTAKKAGQCNTAHSAGEPPGDKKGKGKALPQLTKQCACSTRIFFVSYDGQVLNRETQTSEKLAPPLQCDVISIAERMARELALLGWQAEPVAMVEQDNVGCTDPMWQCDCDFLSQDEHRVLCKRLDVPPKVGLVQVKQEPEWYSDTSSTGDNFPKAFT
ncbi:hypothetical protein BCR37DRAFT_295698 [Protomyces lactucae-debilis]|uniref:Uncharacterized protein n=1 Tax=Protomyces lactucae-debilis TaxID=2754530 RepID=A0A1Y2FGQ2_PROLT|nr:uncharacterized protein BCR37DRAFT_295698 [Protomyces lactucae-debilis]ORY83120.1 hypothetical protein BCR37DRAFT_295698 [Protomyces lactucae-debilis]